MAKKENSLKEEINKFKKIHDIDDISIGKLETDLEEKQNKLFKLKEERGLKNLNKEKIESQLQNMNNILFLDNKKEIFTFFKIKVVIFIIAKFDINLART